MYPFRYVCCFRFLAFSSHICLVYDNSLSGEDISEEIAEVLSTMRAIVNNTARPEMVRSVCALSTAVVTYLSCEEDTIIEDSAKVLHFLPYLILFI